MGREAHVHYLRGMSFGACEVYQAAFAEQIDDAAVGEMVGVDVAGYVAIDFFGGVVQVGDVDFDVEMARVAQNAPSSSG